MLFQYSHAVTTGATVTRFKVEDGSTEWSYTFPSDTTAFPFGNPILVYADKPYLYVPLMDRDGNLGLAKFQADHPVDGVGVLLDTQMMHPNATPGPFPGGYGYDLSSLSLTGDPLLLGSQSQPNESRYGWNGNGCRDMLYFDDEQLFVPALTLSPVVYAWNAGSRSPAWTTRGDAAAPHPYTLYTVLGGVGNHAPVHWFRFEFETLTAYERAGSGYGAEIYTLLELQRDGDSPDGLTFYNDIVTAFADGLTPVPWVVGNAQKQGYSLIHVQTGKVVSTWSATDESTTTTNQPFEEAGFIIGPVTPVVFTQNSNATVDFNAVWSIGANQYLWECISAWYSASDTSDITADTYYQWYYQVGFLGMGGSPYQPGNLSPPFGGSDGIYVWTGFVANDLTWTTTKTTVPWGPASMVTDGRYIYFMPAVTNTPPVVAAFDGTNLAAGPLWQTTLTSADVTANQVSNGILQGRFLYVAVNDTWYVLNRYNGKILGTHDMESSDAPPVHFDTLSDEAMLAQGQLVYSGTTSSDEEGNRTITLYIIPNSSL